MMIKIHTFIVEPGHGDGLVERFSNQGLMDKIIDRSINKKALAIT